ncbi:hypothetical protein [endosymbiont of Ridgeia piscesae]|jgi:hypothetical protein|uniref:Uncharacterized protein n=2 Tax=endosymbiont of Ridgeia piscesae TaxID=54398 RepID=A0A0T5Z201_9GAMM|nr:hypothetical protein [endosymbiont of Ridgeia piscesae]KRT56880.1 hypothetical protein Ga0076813_10531 [endosymbiont of Ridgeia piscesae]
MSQSVISDNWSLQNISELLLNGMEDGEGQYIKIDRENDSYEYKKISEAVIQTEALFDFITDIILRDQIIVDEKFTQAWKQYSSLDKAVNAGVINPFPFLIDYEKLTEPRNEFVDRLCVTSELRTHHEENSIGWEKYKNTPHNYLSQTLWGGAGMLARGFVYEKGYTPHPVRKRLFLAAGITLPSEDAVIQLNNVITEKRAKMSSVNINHDELHSLTINMLPLPIQVIQESNSADEMISVALQLRDEYQELRNWLGCYQQALSDGSYKDILKFKKILLSISQYIDSKIGIIDSNSPTFTASIGVLKVALKGQPVNALKNQFGVRSMVNNLIVSRTGNSDLKKFLNFFGQKKTTVGLNVLENFAKSSA